MFDVSFDGATLVVPFSTGMDESLTDVAVTLSLAEVVLVDELIAPEWSAPVYPNGEGCDDQGCMSASWNFAL